jgi:hypothetical protein
MQTYIRAFLLRERAKDNQEAIPGVFQEWPKVLYTLCVLTALNNLNIGGGNDNLVRSRQNSHTPKTSPAKNTEIHCSQIKTN